MIKTIAMEEDLLLRRILPSYWNYLCDNPNRFLFLLFYVINYCFMLLFLFILLFIILIVLCYLLLFYVIILIILCYLLF